MIDPGLGLTLAALAAPVGVVPTADTSAILDLSLVAPGGVYAAPAPLVAGKAHFAAADLVEVPRITWAPLPASLLKIDPAGVRFNFQF